jgi:transcriptional regulator with XRE-family HTH domain
MTKSWKRIREENSKLTPAQREEIDARVAHAVHTLRQLREARNLTQVTLGQQMELTQAEVSKLEHRSDMYVSTLSRYVEAMGGDLEIRARFPGGLSIPVEIGSLPDREELRVG